MDSINVFIILIVSFFIGQRPAFFGISIDALRIAGGIIIKLGFSLLSGNLLRNEVSIKKPKRMHNNEMILP
jgi:multiple antibiotic resistance protein